MSTIDLSKLRHLAVFATVVESGSFAEAALKLKTSRSRVSEQVAQLEAAIGFGLLHRTTRRLSLTQEGRQIYAEAKTLPAVLECVNDIVSQDEPAGRVCLSLAHNVAHAHVLPILDRFQEAYPKIYLDLTVTDQTSDLVADEIDLAIRTGIPKDSSMKTRLLHEERLAIFASPRFVARAGELSSISDLERLRWISLRQTNPSGSLKLYLNGKETTLYPHCFDTCDSPMVLHKMLLHSLGAGLLLPSSVRREVKEGALVAVLPEISGEHLSISLLFPSRRQIPKRTRCLIDFLVSARLFN